MQTIAGEVPIRYEEPSDTYRLLYDWAHDASVTTAIVMAVGTITDTPPTDIEPVHAVVNPDALENLYAPQGDEGLRCDDGTASFRFHECGVTLHSTGEIEIRPSDGADAVADSKYS